jgi:hypothetical protein
MKIAEETGDDDMKEQAKVNFGMANASMKWTNHVTNILQGLEAGVKEDNREDDDNEEEEEDENDYGQKLPNINRK